jgi:TfoX/Sxy family transcriptional regulator of competence genes
MSKKPAKSTIPADKLAWYDRLIATNPAIERKGVTMPYTAVNGNMFTYLSPEGRLAIRLPKAEREQFLEQYATTLHEAHGTTLKEYVTIPEDLLKDTNTLKRYLDMSYEYVKTLKPKTKRK